MLELNEIKKELMKTKVMAKFSHYVSGKLFYRVDLLDGLYEFPISTVEEIEVERETITNDGQGGYETTGLIKVIDLKLSEDLGDTPFDDEIKGSLLIRWISKAIDNKEMIKVG
jgi:hypothetical protein